MGMYGDRCPTAPSGPTDQLCASNFCEPQVVLIDNLELAVRAEDQVIYYGFMGFSGTPAAKAIDHVNRSGRGLTTDCVFGESGEKNRVRMSSGATDSTTEELEEVDRLVIPGAEQMSHTGNPNVLHLQEPLATTLHGSSAAVMPIHLRPPQAVAAALSVAARRQSLAVIHRHPGTGLECSDATIVSGTADRRLMSQ
ncbi:hypothetical protein BESB_036210 [Besnoitia besnoiti]|uniref:Uncharacterized protein n=1 Tax=Besnoitia besnoiti TaxID=94643 RepID=A0A2A9MMW3_BESBE|nr:hypothetical protein BESB_036210 [Besnoitia besnoiti]PFH37163.1 hypothetical protein BESB_036210 [Besnoitia besnoiti]